MQVLIMLCIFFYYSVKFLNLESIFQVKDCGGTMMLSAAYILHATTTFIVRKRSCPQLSLARARCLFHVFAPLWARLPAYVNILLLSHLTRRNPTSSLAERKKERIAAHSLDSRRMKSVSRARPYLIHNPSV